VVRQISAESDEVVVERIEALRITARHAYFSTQI
jgi:hypothetical protein